MLRVWSMACIAIAALGCGNVVIVNVDGDAIGDADLRGPDAQLADACAINTPESCGACGEACPGLGEDTANTDCTSELSCSFSCVGANYDVNGVALDGCEVEDPGDNHTPENAIDLGPVDADNSPSAGQHALPDMRGVMVSDDQLHRSPSIDGFDVFVGAAPDYYVATATGDHGRNNLDIWFDVEDAADPSCYRMTITTDRATHWCTANDVGHCRIDTGAGNDDYSDDSQIYFAIEKTCQGEPEAATYWVRGRL